MPQRSDAKDKMVRAATQLIRQQGYISTAFSDVLALSQAPRGSVYHHFPRGKVQLVVDAASLHAREQIEIIDGAAEQAGSAAAFLGAYLDLGRDGMLAGDFGRGCAIAPLVTEGGTADSSELADAARTLFAEMTDRIAFHLVGFGVGDVDARELADAVVAGAEGALVTSRALRSPAPFDAVRALVIAYADRVAPAGG